MSGVVVPAPGPSLEGDAYRFQTGKLMLTGKKRMSKYRPFHLVGMSSVSYL